MQIPTEILQKCWFLAGPTACGKTALSLKLAGYLPAEIISLDSMAIYRGMDIGTAKPDATAQWMARHHLIDVVDPHEEFSVADYVEQCAAAAAEILARNRAPLFVGGTGLYLRAVLRGVFAGPAANAELRRQLEEREQREGEGTLYRELEERDPVTADRLHPNDQRRIVRALEVYELTGRPLSEQQRQSALPYEQRPRNVFWLSPPRAWLYDRINQRVDQMMEEGLVEEVRALLKQSPPIGKTARQALGYKEIIDHLEGQTSLPEAVEKLKTRTRQFAKRQHTWFRNLEECRPVEIEGSECPQMLSEIIVHLSDRSD